MVTAAPAGGSDRSVALNLLISLRPGQWTKNLFVFAGLVFGRRLLDPVAALHATAAFAIFCALSGVVYLLNDVVDRATDARHPLKCRRPIASGALSPSTALAAAAVILIAALLAAYRLDLRFFLDAVLYVVLLALYSVWLKHVVIMDALTIAIGFVLRVSAGASSIPSRRCTRRRHSRSSAPSRAWCTSSTTLQTAQPTRGTH